jgi:predicted RNase H-like HicB family nuclease
MSDNLRMTIAYEEPDEDGWIVARVVEVPGAISQGRTRQEACTNVIDALRLMLSPEGNESDLTSDESVELHVSLTG